MVQQGMVPRPGFEQSLCPVRNYAVNWTWFLRPRPHQGLYSSSVKTMVSKDGSICRDAGAKHHRLGRLRRRRFVLSQLRSSG